MALDKQRILEMLDQVANTKGQASVDKANELLAFLTAEKLAGEGTDKAHAIDGKELRPVHADVEAKE